MPPRSVRLRRDISQVLLAIKAHALLHRQHRQIDEREQIVADIWDDYAPVAELMGGIVAEASGAAIRKELAQTIEAVEIATAGMGEDEGVTADKIGKRLRLDKSSAWRRLNNAAFAGFVVNLETRKGQPGRYRLTDQEFEPEELLPSPEALADAFSGAAQPVQPRNLTHNRQVFEELGDCATGCTVAPIAYPPEQVDAFEERAAILEYDGGLSRAEAEAQAARDDVDEATKALYDSLGDIPPGFDRRRQ